MNAKRIFITGGASGLGRALAECYGRAGYRVCIGDINARRGIETLGALQKQGVEAHFIDCDVTREEALQAVADWLQAEWGGADIVVNNAGVAVVGGIDEQSLADWQRAVDINLLGVVRGCKVFTPLFRRQGHGYFVNVASMAGLIHPPMMGAYNATKAAVVALSETLRIELADDAIGVSVVCPAFFRSHLNENLRTGNPQMEMMSHRLVDEAKVSADEVAARVYRGVSRRDFHILTHARERRIWRFKRLLPFPIYAAGMLKQTRKMMERRPCEDNPA